MTDDQMKLEQCEQSIVYLAKLLENIKVDKAEIQARIDAAKEPKWIAAVANKAYGGRLVLNLAALSKCTKDILVTAINKGHKWVSFGDDGMMYSDDCASSTPNGLSRYPDTEIVF